MLKNIHGFSPSILVLATLFAVACATAPAAAPPPVGPCHVATSSTGDTLDVAWLPASRADGADALGRWCAGVGPAVLATSGADRSTAVEGIAVVSWNIHVGGGDVSRLVAELRSGALTAGRPVPDFVLLLQEVHRGGAAVPARALHAAYPDRIDESPPTGERIDIVETAQRLGLHVFYTPSMRNGDAAEDGRAEDRGNAILSTLPIADATAIELPYEAQRRVAVAGTVSGVAADGAEWRLRLASAHLDVRTRLSRILDSFGAARTRQAAALARNLTDDAVVLGGDLNTWSADVLEEAPRLLRRHFPGTPDGATGPTFTAGILPLRLDHLFFRLPDGWTGEMRRIDDRYGSDHHPLLALIRFGPAIDRTGS